MSKFYSMKQFLIFMAYVITLNFFAAAQTKEIKCVIANAEDLAFVIDVPDARFYDGAKLQVWEHYSQSDNQYFLFDIISQHSNDCYIELIKTAFLPNLAFDVTDGKVFENNSVQLWTCYPQSKIQRWELCFEDNYMVIRSCLNRDYVLAVEKPVKNGSKIVIQKYTGADNQKWKGFPIDADGFSNDYIIYKSLYDKSN